MVGAAAYLATVRGGTWCVRGCVEELCFFFSCAYLPGRGAGGQSIINTSGVTWGGRERSVFIDRISTKNKV
jgi:hypothetical protein